MEGRLSVPPRLAESSKLEGYEDINRFSKDEFLKFYIDI